MLKISSAGINESRNTSDHGLSYPFEGPGVVPNGLSGIKNASVRCLFIFNWSYLAIDKKLKDRGRAKVGGCAFKMKCLRTCMDMNCIHCFVWGIHS
jgi:hypothetical protein